MDCKEYIRDFLSAHADGELSGADLREAQLHVNGCEGCRRRLEEERQMKVLLRTHIGAAKAPAQIREIVRQALDREAADLSSIPQAPREAAIAAALRRPAVWIPLAIAACLVLAIVTAHGLRLSHEAATEVVITHPGGIPDFDLVTTKFESFNRRFSPNVPSDTYGEVAGAYVDAHMPGYIWNFNGSGLKMVGGRLDKLPDGRAVTYTMYKGDGSAILCTRYKVSEDNPPPGAVQVMNGHMFYSYYGYSICYSYSPVGSFVCLLVTRRPLKELLQSLVYASG